MSIRLDRFYFDGTHTACVYGEITGEILYRQAVEELQALHMPGARYPDVTPTPLRTVVKSRVTESPWF